MAVGKDTDTTVLLRKFNKRDENIEPSSIETCWKTPVGCCPPLPYRETHQRFLAPGAKYSFTNFRQNTILLSRGRRRWWYIYCINRWEQTPGSKVDCFAWAASKATRAENKQKELVPGRKNHHHLSLHSRRP
jgi:hypothetical protein